MKKLLRLICILLVVLFLSACGGKTVKYTEFSQPESEQEESTQTPYYDVDDQQFDESLKTKDPITIVTYEEMAEGFNGVNPFPDGEAPIAGPAYDKYERFDPYLTSFRVAMAVINDYLLFGGEFNIYAPYDVSEVFSWGEETYHGHKYNMYTVSGSYAKYWSEDTYDEYWYGYTIRVGIDANDPTNEPYYFEIMSIEDQMGGDKSQIFDTVGTIEQWEIEYIMGYNDICFIESYFNDMT